MEAQLSSIVITFFLFLVLLHWLVKYYKPSKTYKLPPGPRKLPIIGNLHQIAAAGSLLHRAFHKFANKYGPLMHLRLGEVSVVVVSSPKMAEEIVKTHDVVFANRPQLTSTDIMSYGGKGLSFAPYGNYWRQMKKISMLELLSSKRVQSFFYIREDETAKFIQSIKSFSGSGSGSGSPINLTSRIFSLVSSIISRSAFGDKCEEQDEFVALNRKVLSMTGGLELADLFPSVKLVISVLTGAKSKLEKMHKQADKILEIIIKKHQEKQRKAKEGNNSTKGDEKEDLVDVLLRIQQSGTLDIPLTTSNIKAVIMDAFAAATDATSLTIEWAMSEMMRNPKMREKAQAELRQAFSGKEIIYENDLENLGYLKLVVKETLRLHPPAPLLLPRECTQLTNIDGYDIPINTKVMINVWAMGRDPQYWTDAERFIPERFDGSLVDFKGNNFEYLPFGAGRRKCPGMSFGIATIMLPLAMLLYHFNWELPNKMKPEDLDMTEHYGLTNERKSELCLIPTVYDV